MGNPGPADKQSRIHDRFRALVQRKRFAVQGPVPGKGRVVLSVPNFFGREEVDAVKELWERLRTSPPFLVQVQSVSKRQVLLDTPYPMQGRRVLVKIYRYRELSRILETLFYPSDASRNFSTLVYLQSRGVGVTPALGLISAGLGPVPRWSLLLTEHLDQGVVDYKRFLHEVDGMEGHRRSGFFAALGRALGELHNAGVFTKDTDKNLLVRPKGDDFGFHFLDFDSVFPWRVPNVRRAGVSLSKFLVPGHRYTAEDVNRFLDGYCATRGREEWRDSFLSMLVASLRRERGRFLEVP